MLRGLTTGESQPSVVKCGVRANADDTDADADADADVDVDEELEEE